MNCYVINLAAQTDRWQAMSAQFARMRITVARFDAVRGDRLSEEQIRALYSPPLNRRQYHCPLTVGEIGCYASHLAVWRALLDSDEPCAAVFEDDLILSDRLVAILRAVPTLPAGWEVLKLFGRTREKIAGHWPWIDGHQLIRYGRVPSYCAGYLINREGAEKLLRTRVPFGRPVDVDLRYWWENGSKILGVLPYPVSLSTHSEQSTIGDRSHDRNFLTRFRRFRLQADYNLRNWLAVKNEAD